MLGVIADTHGLFDPAIPCCFDGVDHIIHAGDIEGRSILRQLEAIAPVTAVSENVDGDECSLPRECTLFLAGHRIAIRHVIYNGGHLTKEGRAFLDREQPGVCIFGHTHQPSAEWLGQVFPFNYGSAGPKRFHLPRASDSSRARPLTQCRCTCS